MNRRTAQIGLAAAAVALALLGAWWIGGSGPPPAPTPGAEARVNPVDPELARSAAGGASKERLAAGSRAIGRREGGDPRSRTALTPPVMLPNREDLKVELFRVDQQGITAAVESRRADLQECYETARFHTPGLGGNMVLAMTVEPTQEGKPLARVASVDVESELDATVLEGCVATVFEELQFATTEPVTIRYPVQFDDDTPSLR